MARKNLSKEFLKRLSAVKGKRSRTVVDHILKHGYISTEELKEKYGYDHPPRAVRDVREQGIPIETFAIDGSHGRKIAAYRFGDPASVRGSSHRGRIAVPKSIKKALLERCGERCAICRGAFSPTQLQVDHCVPYEVAGEGAGKNAVAEDHMLVCGSCNRAKSWTCEHCTNWSRDRQAQVCLTCYWASPAKYDHIASEAIRRVELVWQGTEVHDHQSISAAAIACGMPLPEFVKEALRKHFSKAYEARE